MGEAELKAALQRETDSQVRQLWDQSEAEVATYRRQIEAEIARLRKVAAARLAAATTAERDTILLEAHQQAAERRLCAAEALNERLKQLAMALLPELCGQERARIWQRLLDELPAADWQQVLVHPADLEQARRALPAARVEAAEALGGGLVVELEQGRIRIDNSLLKRFERGWPVLLPKLFAAIRAQVESNGPVEPDRTE